MATLGDIDKINKNITSAPAKAIQTLHKLIFEDIPKDRKNRKRLKEFAGFTFELDSKDFKLKKEFINNSFTEAELGTICSILCINDGTKEVMIDDVCNYLSNLGNLLIKIEQDEEEENDYDENFDTKNKLNDKMDETRDALRKVSADLQKKLKIEKKKIEDSSDDEFDSRSSSSVQDRPKFSLTFRDIEGTLKTYNGSDGYPVKKWIEDFEEAATLMDWNSLQKFIFAKKSLDGLAKLFIQGEKGITSWSTLKKALREEFDVKTSTADIHRLLNNRKKKREESLQEYFLVMREIASRGDIEDDALIQYIIDGIEDDSGTKLLLYGAQNLKEFKEKLRHYKQAAAKIPTKKTFRTNYNENPKNSTGKDVKTSSDSNTKHVNKGTSKRCYNCGEFGHTSNECEHKRKGKKCFNCGGFGHISADCTMERKQNPKKSVTMNANSKETDGYKFKDVKLCNQTVKALIDCGSQLNLIRRNVYDSASAPELKKTDMIISGFGKNFVSPQGYFTTMIEIDEIEFETDVYVVSEDAMKMDMIIGNDLLDQAEVLMNKNGVTVRKPRLEAHLMCIQIVEQPEIKIESTVSKEVKKKVEDMVSNYVPKRTKTTDVKMKISVKDEQPIYSNPRRLSPQEKEIVDKQLSTWIDDGIIEQSSSEYASQVLVVKKKNGTSRICIDFRKLNRIVVKDRYPLPLIDDILDRLQDARVFCTMDLRNGFFHVDVEEGSRKYTSFITHAGQYQFRKVPFGLCNSPAVFQRFINTAFRPLMAQGVALIYMDDIIIPAKDDEEALERLRQVLELSQDYGLDINFEKCQFMKRVVQFLGYTIQYGQIQPSLEKTIAVQNFPEPKTKTGLHSFIGLTSYFRKFIPEYALIAKPLSDMLKKDQEFRFEEDQRKAFQKLKDLLASSPVLNIYNPKYETELHTDASKFGYGAVLLQKCPDDGKLHPVSYMSRKTTEQEEKYSSYELEILAVMNALKKFRVYLLGIDFKIVTDCAAFQKTMDKKDISPRVARWAMSLEEYSYTIEHRAGSRMKHADALSRCTTVLFGFADILATKIKKAQEEDEGIIAIKQILKEKPYDDFEFRDGLLFKFSDGRETLVVPRGMQTEIIKAAHEKGHYSCKRTEEDIKQEFYIPNLTDKVKRVISNCIRCLVVNRKAGKKEGVLHPLFKESLPIHTYHVDHIGPLESTHKGYKHILVVVDSFSKYTWLYPVKTTKSNETIAKLELQKTNFGNPFQIITDRGTSFTSQEFEDYCRSEDIKHVLITTGLPRANGQVERMNSTIANIIAKLSISDPTKWYKVVPDVQRAMNSTYQRSIGRSPFELLVGVKMRNKTDIRVLDLLNEELIAIFEDRRDEFREDAKMQIEKVQNENRASFNRRRTEATRYNEGDLVAIKRTQFGPGLKLKPKNLGPYRITKVKGNDTYDVSREGDCEGPRATTSCAEFMQPWPQDYLSSESDDGQEGRVWESDAEEFLGFPAVSSEEVRAAVGNTVTGEQGGGRRFGRGGSPS